MARNVFISFRFSDGEKYKKELCKLFDKVDDVIDTSEDEDRSDQSEETIKKYLYSKLKRSSVTIVLLTPNAIDYNRTWTGKCDDWMYDELRYSLEDRDGNLTNGVIAVYTEEAKNMLYSETTHKCNTCNAESDVICLSDFDNLVRKNMLNVLAKYKTNKCDNIYDSMEDSYISLISLKEFKKDINKYIENAVSKKERRDQFKLVKTM